MDERHAQSGIFTSTILAVCVVAQTACSADSESELTGGHWAFQPIRAVAVPQERGASEVRNPIDQFILRRLHEASLQPSRSADRRTLIRRLSNDVLGLPPDPVRVKQFVEDSDPLAWQKLVDEYLGSPRFGEHWARHWLDIAHYADTHGFERDKMRPHAWRYRDYVIRAFNRDEPYDSFLVKQLAGDAWRHDDPESIIATGFLAAGPWDFVGQVETASPALRQQARGDDLDDMVAQVMTSTMGLTVHCARCHDHKMDPITQDEYYALWAVFSGTHRGDRDYNSIASQQRQQQRAERTQRLSRLRGQINRLTGEGLSLADMVGGGSGLGEGEKGAGIDLRNGQLTERKLGYHRDIQTNRLQKLDWARESQRAPGFVQWVFVPDGREPVPVVYRKPVDNLPATSGHTWDAVRNGSLNSQVSTTLDGVDYGRPEHMMLGLHANSGVTFDLRAIRRVHGLGKMLRLTMHAGSGARKEAAASRVDFSVFADQQLLWQKLGFRKSDSWRIDVLIPATASSLTLVATDGGDGIGHDLLFLGDPEIRSEPQTTELDETQRKQLAALRAEAAKLESLLALPDPETLVYAVQSKDPEPVSVLRRGNPADPMRPVQPSVLSCIPWTVPVQFEPGASDQQRRLTLAGWITDPANPLTPRVAVNRIWHHYFGRGIVETPGDFGLAGSEPTHPGLLDWLASELQRNDWSLKHVHRLILLSATYRQRSLSKGKDDPRHQRDADNRLVWRQSSRRLSAEAIRDAVLSASGSRSDLMYGPGYRDFRYTEAYAPIYEYVTPDSPALWRRSIYRFVVRTTPHQFLTTLDCPNPANLTPRRVQTTTPLQALTLMNNEFMLRQSQRLADRCGRDGVVGVAELVERAFRRVLQRSPDREEMEAATRLVRKHGMVALCRALLNTNEFLYID